MGLVQKTVLIVDDDKNVARFAQQVLERRGLRTVIAATVEEAFNRLDDSIDAVLLDLELPDVSGHAFLRGLRERGLRDLPVIIMSGTGTIEDVIEALRNHASDYVRKPFFPEQLTAAIDRAFRDQGTKASPPAASPGHTTAGAEVEALLTSAERESLSAREREIVGLLAEGRRAPEMAGVLDISPHTIRNHLKAIYRKMDVHSQGALAELLLRRRRARRGA